MLKERDALKEEGHELSFVVNLYEPLPPVYFVRIISDKWMRCETVLPASFRYALSSFIKYSHSNLYRNFILPDKYPPQTEKLDLDPIKIDKLEWNPAIDYFREKFETFNSIQTQVFKSFYLSDESVFLGAPTSSGKTA